MSATLYYFPAAGRAELSRLIAAAGSIELKEGGDGSDLDKSAFGSPSGVPLLSHGDLKISQSGAIEAYLSLLSFPDLAPSERAVDAQFCCIKEDISQGVYKVFFGAEHSTIPVELLKVIDKWFPIVEGRIPSAGFINSMPYPTAADLAVVNLCEAFMPFGAALKHTKLDMALKYPKMKALVDRTMNVTKIQAYIAASTTFKADPPPINLGSLKFEELLPSLDPKAGDVVLVTGTSTGIGASIALKLAKDGFVVFAAMRGPLSRKEAVAIREGGCQVVELDVTSDVSCAACVEAVISKAGRIDALINNAGVGDSDMCCEEAPMKDFVSTMETNYLGAVRMARLVLPGMRSRKKGAIINMTSNAAIAWGACMGAYNASKTACEAFTATLMQEVFRLGIRVCTVRPGVIQTPILGKNTTINEASPYFDQMSQKKRMAMPGAPGPTIVSDQISILLAEKGNWEPAYDVGPDAVMVSGIIRAKGAAWVAGMGKIKRTDEEIMQMMASFMG